MLKPEKYMYNVMMVDDEPWALIGLSEIIDWEKMGLHIADKCKNAKEALKRAAENPPDALITDIRMPDMTGLELIEEVKKSHPDTVCLIVSAYSDFEVAREALRLSAVDYILKPLDEEEVKKAAGKLLEILSDRNVAGETAAEILMNDSKPMLPQELVTNDINYLVMGSKDDILALAEEGSSIIKYKDHYAAVIGETGDKDLMGCGISPGFLKKDIPEDIFKLTEYSLLGGFRYAAELAGDKTKVSAAKVQAYIYEHLAEEITLSDLAGQFYITETYLCDVFKKKTGETILNFLKKVRMEKAARLLRESNASLQEISEECGYNDYSYFGKQFKSRWDQSPEDYRKNRRKKSP